MRIGIISDTHDRVARTTLAVQALRGEGIAALIHCGDLTTPAVVRACAGVAGYFVYGNNDFDRAGLRRAIEAIGGTCLDDGGEIALGGRRLAVTHGDSDREVRRLLAAGPDYLFSGHTHCPDDQWLGPTRLINPGALYRAEAWTVALLDLASGGLRLLTIRDGRGSGLPG